MVHAQRREGETNLVAETMLKTMPNTPSDAGGGGEAADEVSRWFWRWQWLRSSMSATVFCSISSSLCRCTRLCFPSSFASVWFFSSWSRVFPSVSCSSSSVYNGFPQWWRGVWEKDDELRKDDDGVGSAPLYFPPSVSEILSFPSLRSLFSRSTSLVHTSHPHSIFQKSLLSFFFPLFSFKRALSRPKNPPSAAGVESSIYRLEGRGLLLRVGSRGAACWSARQGAWGFRFGHCSMF